MAGILGPVIGFGQEGFTVTIYGAGASIFDGVMGSVRDHGLSGIIRLTNFYFLRFSGLIVCTMAMAAVLGFLFPGPGEIAFHRGKTMRLPLSEIGSGSLLMCGYGFLCCFRSGCAP